MDGVTRLKSSDGQIFVVSNKALLGSETLNSMLNLTEEFSDEEEVMLEKVDSHNLKVIVDWLTIRSEPSQLTTDQLFELIVHVNYLNIPELLEWCCQAVVDKLIMEKDGRYKIDVKPACFNRNCKESCNVTLQNCARCKVAKYCSKDCQAEDWRRHKGDCKAINTQMKAMDKEAKTLENCFWDGQYQNLFQTQYGHFWVIRETRDFCRAKYRLAAALVELADKKKQKHIYDAAIHQYLSLLRLVFRDNMGLREQLPYVFLKANRDQDCYDFLKWWIVIGDIDNIPKSKEGDWLYLKGENLQESPAYILVMMERPELTFHVALFCIKSRIVSKCKSILYARSEMLLAAATPKLRPLNDMLPKLIDVLREKSPCEIRGLEKIISTQLTQSDLMMSVIKKRSKRFFPAVLNPDPLLSQPSPTTLACDTPEETHYVLKQCLDIIKAIPGAVKKIRSFVGNKRQYDHEFYIRETRGPYQEGILMWNHYLNRSLYPQHFKGDTVYLHPKHYEIEEALNMSSKEKEKKEKMGSNSNGCSLKTQAFVSGDKDSIKMNLDDFYY